MNHYLTRFQAVNGCPNCKKLSIKRDSEGKYFQCDDSVFSKIRDTFKYFEALRCEGYKPMLYKIFTKDNDKKIYKVLFVADLQYNITFTFDKRRMANDLYDLLKVIDGISIDTKLYGYTYTVMTIDNKVRKKILGLINDCNRIVIDSNLAEYEF